MLQPQTVILVLTWHAAYASKQPNTFSVDEQALIALVDSMIANPIPAIDCDAHELDTRHWTADPVVNVESDFATPFLPSESEATFVHCVTDDCTTETHTTQTTTPDLDTIQIKTVNDDVITLPDHVNVLFLQTIANKDLGLEAEEGLKQLPWDHRDTFAKSKTDIGFCDLVQHDIDTGDTRPIKQSPRRPL